MNAICGVSDCENPASQEDWVNSKRFKIGVCDEHYAEKHGDQEVGELDRIHMGLVQILKLKKMPDSLKPGAWLSDNPYVTDQQLAALHRLILKERRDAFQSIVVTAKEHSDVTIQADGWPIMTRIRQLDAEIEGSNKNG